MIVAFLGHWADLQLVIVAFSGQWVGLQFVIVAIPGHYDQEMPKSQITDQLKAP